MPTRVAQTKLHYLKTRVGGPDQQFPHWISACNCSQRVWKENGILSIINLYFAFKNNLTTKNANENIAFLFVRSINDDLTCFSQKPPANFQPNIECKLVGTS